MNFEKKVMQKFSFLMTLHRIEVGGVPISPSWRSFSLILHCACIDFPFMTVTFHPISEIGTPPTSILCNFMKNDFFCMILKKKSSSKISHLNIVFITFCWFLHMLIVRTNLCGQCEMWQQLRLAQVSLHIEKYIGDVVQKSFQLELAAEIDHTRLGTKYVPTNSY